MMQKILITVAAFLISWSAIAQISQDAEVRKVIVNNDAAALEQMLADGLDINAYNKQGDSLVYYALKNDCSAQILKILVDGGADVNAPSAVSGETPLVYAVAAAEHIQAEAKHILENELTPQERSAMEEDFKKAAVAEMKRAAKIVELLIDLGADVNQETPFGTPLMRASSNSWNTQIVDILLKSGADVNQADQNGRTALFYSETYGCVDISMQLIAAGADVYHRDVNGKTYVEIERKEMSSDEIIHDM